MENKENDFLKRKEAFEKDFVKLQQKYQVGIYPANCVLPNQEVAPMLRISDLKDANKTQK